MADGEKSQQSLILFFHPEFWPNSANSTKGAKNITAKKKKKNQVS